MEKQKKPFVIVTFVICMFAVGLTVTSFRTEHWLTSSPKRNLEDNVTLIDPAEDDGSKFTANVSLGLFQGLLNINHGVGTRDHIITVKDEIEKDGTWAYGLWGSTIASMSFGIIWGLVAMFFAVYNVCAKPIETVTGPLGLYLWNGFASFFTLLAVILYVILFFLHYKENVLPDQIPDGWVTDGKTQPDYSLYLLVGASLLYLVNFVVLFSSGLKLKCSYSSSAEKTLDNGTLFLY